MAYRNTQKYRLGAVLVFIASALLLAGCGGATVSRTPSEDILVSPQWLLDNAAQVTILDFSRSQEDFAAGHIPGAVFVDRVVVWDEVNGIPGMLPAPEIAARDLADLGVHQDKPVVIYDAGNSLWASRLFWGLEYLGHQNVHLLDGGFSGWVGGTMPVSTDVVPPPQGDFEARVQDGLIATMEYIEQRLGNDDVVVIDTRSAGEYDGTDVRSARGGHIPGALHLEWTENLADDSTFKSAIELAALFALEDESTEAITLCQTGVRGAHSYVALRVAGYQNVRLYDGSWAEWGNDPDAPIEL